MGFCRRCGEIVVGVRCKCGGSSVGDDDSKQDRWSRTYVTKDTSPSRPESTSTTASSVSGPIKPSYTGSNQAKRFPRPGGYSSSPQTRLEARVSAHIASATTPRPTSPLKHSATASEDSNAEEGILPNLHHGSELAKVYGSVLQPKESLDSYACAICSTVFPPDATIYPDPSTISPSGERLDSGLGTRFLCRPCFVEHGGSKGDCPACHRPVLILKAEGGFVEAAGNVWHRKCFNCDGCLKNIGDHPMVDLLGRPSCADCFETCLKRPTRDSTPTSPMNNKVDSRNNLGGFKRTDRSREGSPALEELEQRLGIIRSRENTPAKEERVGRLNLDAFSPKTHDPQGSPASNHYRSSYSRESSPTVERLSGRVRANSSTNIGFASPYSNNTSSTRILNRYKSPEPDSSDTDAGSPRMRRQSYSRLKSPEPEVDDGVLMRRSLNRFQSPEPDIKSSTPMSGLSRSPRHSSPSPKPTEAAIEEMKRRFLNQASSPRSGAQSTTSSTTTTPRRRSRSRPRTSDTPTVIDDVFLGKENIDTTSRKGNDVESRVPTVSWSFTSPGLKTRASTSSLRSALKAQTTGGTEFSGLRSQRTGESTMPLIRSQRTGDTEYTIQRDLTGGTSYLSRQRTGDTTYISQQDTGMTSGRTIRRQRTGDTDYVRRQPTGETLYPQSTGQTDHVRRQRTGDTELRSQKTGDTTHTLRRQRTGDTEIRAQRTGETVYTLRRDRTGDAEVESLLGAIPTKEDGDLIDLSIPASHSSGPMSKIPIPTRRSVASVAGIRTSRSNTSLRQAYGQSVPPTPDLSDFSDTMSTQSSGPSTPPSISPPSRRSRDSLSKSPIELQHTGSKNTTPTPTPKSKRTVGGITIPEPLPADTRCAKCHLPLFNTKHGGKFVTVPEEPTSSGIPPKTYHTSCFKCNVCGDVFEEREGGHAVFVRGEEGACHVRCAPPEKITLRKVPTVTSTPASISSRPLTSIQTSSAKYVTSSVTSSSRYERPPPTAPPTAATFTFPPPRFGGNSTCPECNQAVSLMERGVVPGPQGSRWHAACLICGGKDAKGRRKEYGKPGCGKKLDSAAKTDAEGHVWCRECLLLLPPSQRQASPIPSPIVPTATGGRGTVVAPQYTGTTTIAPQFTGIGGSDAALLRQLTGGGLSPTRQLSSSPTKMHDGPRPGAARYPRPKSVTGVRSAGGEGRGMFLVRQLTGGNNSFSGNDYGL
ncbi:unnamed protein product [Somion occarium]|uniref:LIM zinc-binding domain-containing protein n=1 Tax=Somion occarium TaxID=3059160 RepID=A0ABP1CKB2_9APHY